MRTATARKTLTCWRASRQGLRAGTWSEPYYADTHPACPLVARAAAQVWVRESRQAGGHFLELPSDPCVERDPEFPIEPGRVDRPRPAPRGADRGAARRAS
jgi:hypothetical protein